MRAAFTLLELILVLAVLGFLTAVAAARLGGLRGTQRIEQAARLVGEEVQRCQRLAAAHGQAVRLRLDLDARTAEVRLLAIGAEQLPTDGQSELVDLGGEQVALTYTGDGGKTVAAGAVDLLFLPDGVCDQPGDFTATQDGRSATVRVRLGSGSPTRLAQADTP